VVLFAGMIVFLLFAECVNRASTLIVVNANYVKRVVFPLEILPWVTLGSAMFHFLISAGVLVVASLVLRQTLPWTFVFFPLVMVCLGMLIMGFAWLLAAFGVYLRDMAPTVAVLTSLTMFLSPVFYDMDTLAEKNGRLAFWMQFNPLTFLIEQMRRIFIKQQLPDFLGLLIYFLCACLFAWFGLMVFQKLRKGFADVI
jgi:lipopolysaccharide transport system permease protein